MKKIQISVLFLVILLLLLAVSSALFLPKDNTVEAGIDERDERALGILAEEPDTLDVVVLGDSESCTGISPLKMWKEYGITSYICGQTAQRMPEAYYMLKRVIKKQAPKLVILETNLLFWPEDKMEGIKKSIYEAGSYYFPVFRYHDQWKNLGADDFKKPDYKNKAALKGLELKKETLAYQGGEYMHETVTAQGMAMMESYYLRKLVSLCDKKGIRLFLVSVPSPKNWNYERHNSVSAFAKKHELDFMDLNLLTEELGLDWSKDSLDGGDHLNIYGAEKVSLYLGEYMTVHYGLPDHRKESKYDSWNADYNLYRKERES